MYKKLKQLALWSILTLTKYFSLIIFMNLQVGRLVHQLLQEQVTIVLFMPETGT